MIMDKHFNPIDEPGASISWKNSDVCVSLYCPCGYVGHYDGEYFRYYQCPSCGQKYEIGNEIALKPLSRQEVIEIEKDTFHACLYKGK
jgi:hypothetical protein